MKNIQHGIVGGLVGGTVFGALMAKVGTLPMIGKMVGFPSAPAGLTAHLIISAILGAGFAILLGRVASARLWGTLSGVVYGALWWLLGPLTLMPLFMGMGLGVNWSLGAAADMLPSLWGHLLYGALLGYTYGALQDRQAGSRAAGELPAQGS